MLLPRNTEQWHLFMCDKQVFTLLTAVPYGTEVLSPCLPLASSIPGHRCQPLGCSLPHLLLHAWWIFWQEHRDIFLGYFFASLPVTLMLCAQVVQISIIMQMKQKGLCFWETLRPADISEKCHIALMQSGSPG